MAASELKSNISNVKLNKSKKKLFLYFDNGHTNQTNPTEKIWFFYTLLTSTKILRGLMRRNVVLSAYNRASYFDQTQAIM